MQAKFQVFKPSDVGGEFCLISEHTDFESAQAQACLAPGCLIEKRQDTMTILVSEIV